MALSTYDALKPSQRQLSTETVRGASMLEVLLALWVANRLSSGEVVRRSELVGEESPVTWWGSLGPITPWLWQLWTPGGPGPLGSTDLE